MTVQKKSDKVGAIAHTVQYKLCVHLIRFKFFTPFDIFKQFGSNRQYFIINVAIFKMLIGALVKISEYRVY